jgi:hypothetical protein
MAVAAPEIHTKLRKVFDEALLHDDTSAKHFKTESQRLISICNSNNECFTFLASLISDTVGANQFTNASFVLHLVALLSRRGEVVVNIITDFGDLLTFLVKHVTANTSSHCQLLAMRCVTSISKCKSGKSKLPQMSGFVSFLCNVIKEGKVDECALFFSISVLSRLLELYENRTGFGEAVVSFGETSFYDAIGRAAASSSSCSSSSSPDSGDYTGHACRLLLHLTRIEQHRLPIAHSKPLILTLRGALQTSLAQGASTTVPARCAVVSLMNLAGCPENRLLLASTDDLVLHLVQIAALAAKGKTSQYCLAALLNLAWEGPNRVLFMGVAGLLDVVVAAMRSVDEKAAMYAVGIICNLSCVEEHQLYLGQCTQPDVVAALVQAVKTGTGFTKDDAVGSLTNLSAVSLNRILIATRLEQLQTLFDYIRTHHGICRQRAVVLLQNLATTFSSLDFFLQHEVSLGDNVLQLQDILKSCESELTIATALQCCIRSFCNRRDELQAGRSSTPSTSGENTNIPQTVHRAPPAAAVVISDSKRQQQQLPINKEAHAVQLFEMLKKTKHDTLQSKQQQQQQHPPLQQKQPEIPTRSMSSRKDVTVSNSDMNSRSSAPPVNPAKAGDSSHSTQECVRKSKNEKTSAGLLVSKPRETVLPTVQSLETAKKSKKDAIKLMTRKPQQQTQQPSQIQPQTHPQPQQPQHEPPPEQQREPESVAENTSPITRPKQIGTAPHNIKQNMKSNDTRQVNRTLAKSFIGTRSPNLYYSSDDSDDCPPSKQKRKNPHGHQFKSMTMSASAAETTVTPTPPAVHDAVAQPKELKSRRHKKERKRSTGTRSERENEKKKSSHRVAEYKALVPSAHPPTSTCPSSGRSPPVMKSRHIVVNAESKSTKPHMFDAEDKSPKPLPPRGVIGADSKRNQFSNYDESDGNTAKAQSKSNFFGNILDTTDDDAMQTKGVDCKPSVSTLCMIICGEMFFELSNNIMLLCVVAAESFAAACALFSEAQSRSAESLQR